VSVTETGFYMEPRKWLVEALRFFKELGFFREYSEFSLDELADKLEQKQEEEWGETFDPADRLSDLDLLRWDSERVWWRDTEADVCEENKVYENTLREWSAISRGSFLPTCVGESWQSENGPVCISFRMHGCVRAIVAKYIEDYIDMSILRSINEVMRSDYRFEMHRPFDQTAFVVMLSRAERKEITKERLWRFVDW